MVGVVVNNSTNRLAIAKADARAEYDREEARSRDHDAWRKQIVLETVAELLVLSNEVCQRIWRHDSWTVHEMADVNDELSVRVSNGRTLLGRLFLVSNGLADDATRLIDALHEGLDEATSQRSGELGRTMTAEERTEAEASYRAAMDSVYRAEMNLMGSTRSEIGIDLAPPVKPPSD